MIYNYDLEDMDGNEVDSTLAADDVEALAIFSAKVGGRLETCDGAEASHVIVRASHQPGAAGQGLWPQSSDEGPMVIFAKRAAPCPPPPTSPSSATSPV